MILPTGINAPHLVSSTTPFHKQSFDVEQELLARKLSECGAKTVLVAGLQCVAFHQRYLRERANKNLDSFLAGYFHKTRLPKTCRLLLKAAARDPVLMKFLLEEVPSFASYRKLKGVARRERKWRGEPAKRLTRFATGGCAGATYVNLLLSPHLQHAVVRLAPGVVMPNKPPYMQLVRLRQLDRAALSRGRKIPAGARKPFKPNH